MNEAEDQMRDLINTMTRHWWAVFNELDRTLERGDVQMARKVCQECKAMLHQELKEGWEK